MLPINPASAFIHLIREITKAQQQHSPVASQAPVSRFYVTAWQSENKLKKLTIYIFIYKTVWLNNSTFDKQTHM